jgi:hypothetical protein
MEGNRSIPQPFLFATPQQIGYLNSRITNGFRFELVENVKKSEPVKPKHSRLHKLVIY